MANLNDLPVKLIYMIIAELAQLSYRDRARVACVNRECHRIADSEDSYRAQYIRDFGAPPQEFIWPKSMFEWETSYHTSAEPESEPPKH